MLHPMLLEISLGLRMAVFGLLLGGACWLTTRPGSRRPTGPYGRGQDRAARWLKFPLLVVGVVGILLLAVGH
jgi:hypothetical protein